MLKAVTLPTLLAATLLATGAAQAGDHGHAAAIQPTSPQSIADVIKAGGGTVSGTVEKAAANWFVLTDGRDRIDVASRGFLPEGIQSGDQITVVGGVRQGAIQAGQIIRQDGTAFGRNAMQKHEGRRHGHDKDQDKGRHGDRDDD
ncbi:cytochrome c maturation protein CcmE [Azospirillum sp. B506]|uniref:cytochrome c maturation protein CcmE domain-containing protein n=1 Tax=Azospirillum sp. B506 TaxID=137721 RepID=UPI00034B5BCC|nr:cytochrome c maturation protein CcmE [Azospirillum sp. B506]